MTRMITIRRLAAGASLLLVASASACGGGGSGAPDNASKDGFCEAYNGLFEAMVASGADQAKAITGLKKWAADMGDVGTPEDMPEDARRGFELLVETAKDIDEDATAEELANLEDEFDSDERKDGEAFSTWATEECPSDLGDLGGLPTDIPS